MASRFPPGVGHRESMQPRPRLGGDSPRAPITFPSTTHHVLGLAALRISCIYWRLTTMRQSANGRVSSRPKKSGNTAAGIPRPSGEAVHLPGAGAVANRDQVSSVLFSPFLLFYPFPARLLSILCDRVSRRLASKDAGMAGYRVSCGRMRAVRRANEPLRPDHVCPWAVNFACAFTNESTYLSCICLSSVTIIHHDPTLTALRLRMTTTARPAEAAGSSSAATAAPSRSTSSASTSSVRPSCRTTGSAMTAFTGGRRRGQTTEGPSARCSTTWRRRSRAHSACPRRCRCTLRTSRPGSTGSTRR